MAKFTDDDTFGMTVFMPHLALQLELDRGELSETIEMIDEELDEIGVTTNLDLRITEVLSNAVEISLSYLENTIDKDTAVSEIAFSFLYVYCKQNIDPPLNDIHGMIAILTEENVFFNTAVDEKTYQDAVDIVRRKAEDSIEQDKKPTIH